MFLRSVFFPVIQYSMTRWIRYTVWLLDSTWTCLRIKWIRSSILWLVSIRSVNDRMSPVAPMS